MKEETLNDRGHSKQKKGYKTPSVPCGFDQPCAFYYSDNNIVLDFYSYERKSLASESMEVNIEWPWVDGYKPTVNDWGNIDFLTIFSNSEDAQDNAMDVIEKHNFKAYYYLPSIGYRNDEELSNALNLLSSSGFIIVDSEDKLVGKAEKTRLSSQEKAESRRSTFKVVESD